MTGTDTISLPAAEDFIRTCLYESPCTRVGFTAQLQRSRGVVVARLSRNGEDFWNGKENPCRLLGHTDSYPTIDLHAISIEAGTTPTSWTELLSDALPARLQTRIDELLREVEVYLRPKNADVRVDLSTRDHAYIDMKLVAPKGVPAWLIGINALRMRGAWTTFIDPTSPEFAIARAFETHSAAAKSLASAQEQEVRARAATENLSKSLPRLEDDLRRLYAGYLAR